MSSKTTRKKVLVRVVIFVLCLLITSLGTCSAEAADEAVQDSPADERFPPKYAPNSRGELLPHASFPEIWPSRSPSHPKNMPFHRNSASGAASYGTMNRQTGGSSIIDAEGRLTQWYAGYLQQFAEEPFSESSKNTVLRFLLLRSMAPPICVTVNLKAGQAASITGKEIVGTKLPVHHTNLELTMVQLSLLKKKINSPELWKESSSQPSARESKDPISIWILESWDGKRYKHVEQRSPQSGPVRDLGKQLLALAGLSETAKRPASLK